MPRGRGKRRNELGRQREPEFGPLISISLAHFEMPGLGRETFFECGALCDLIPILALNEATGCGSLGFHANYVIHLKGFHLVQIITVLKCSL